VLRRLLRLSRTFLPYRNYLLANTPHSRLLCFILPQSGSFRIPYGHGCLADFYSLLADASAPRAKLTPMAASPRTQRTTNY
jgi:hypothetical protein